MSKLLIREKAIENLNKKVILKMKKPNCDPFTREVIIVKVCENCLVCKGISGMEWPYVIEDEEMKIIEIK